TSYNGHDYTVTTTSGGVTTTTVYANPGSPAVYSYTGHGIYQPQVQQVAYPILRCPSDMSLKANNLDLSDQWATTSYLPNWHAFTPGTDKNDVPGSDPWNNTRAQRFSNWRDGTSTVILFADAYANCDRVSRKALLDPTYWSFGLDWYGIKNTL